MLPAFKFRLRCVQTEEKIYQYIERNNLRLGESIDLKNLCEKYPYKELDSKISGGHTPVKEEVNEFADMPHLTPEAGIGAESEDDVVHIPNETPSRKKVQTNSIAVGTNDSANENNESSAVEQNNTNSSTRYVFLLT